MEITIWQAIVSPHMLGLAESLASLGHDIVYAHVSRINAARQNMGWPALDSGKCELAEVSNTERAYNLIANSSDATIHLMRGIRGDRVLACATREIIKRNASIWCMLETVDERAWRRLVKRPLYRRLLAPHIRNRTHFLAIGMKTADWLVSLGVPRSRTHQFTYFLPPGLCDSISGDFSRVRLGFVGQMVQRKRFDLLVEALRPLANDPRFELVVIGDGPLASAYREKVKAMLASNRLQWLGTRPMSVSRKEIASLDRLILPSDHDGWGAVVSEALLSGTPVICSDACGAAVAVDDPLLGQVFPAGSVTSLRRLLQLAIDEGPVSSVRRSEIKRRSARLSADYGAKYLETLLAGGMNLPLFNDPQVPLD